VPEAVQPPGVPDPVGPYSNVFVSGDLVLLSGQVPYDETGTLVGPDFATQADQVFRNIEACLQAVGCGFQDILKITAYLADFEDFAEYNGVYARYLEPPYPARTTVQAVLYGFSIEIDAIARRPAGPPHRESGLDVQRDIA
jgi:2-iminobutanoate/2-iminopropanoate deaminase